MARKETRKTAKKISSAKARNKPVPKEVGRSRTAAKAALPPATGPVTLDEARALVQAKHPKLAVRALRKGAAPPASPAAVGAERQKLEQARREERARRISEYKATLEIMKSRGARRPRRNKTAKAATGEPVAKDGDGETFSPLQILAEGDSWFDYPVPFFGGGIVPRLETLLGVPILNLAKAGDEVRYMLGVDERKIMIDQLTNGCPAGGPWDVVLFSGGGNDIVGNPMALWVNDWNAALPPLGQIRTARFAAALELVRAGYEDLIALRDQLSPGTHLIFHGYDFAIPDGRGICGFGPWLKPTFDLHKFPSQADGQAVVKEMLKSFAATLQALTRANVSFIQTQGTLAPVPASWHNELHPAKAGFDTFAGMFQQQLKVLFPARVA
jgi:hypothetical protein